MGGPLYISYTIIKKISLPFSICLPSQFIFFIENLHSHTIHYNVKALFEIMAPHPKKNLNVIIIPHLAIESKKAFSTLAR